MLKARQKLGKYRIERRLGEGGFAVVYAAMDTIEGIRVALKVPRPNVMGDELMRDFRHEARMIAKLDHPHILPLKDASIIDDQFVIVSHLGERTLEDRLRRRMSFEIALNFSEQMLDAVAYAHGRNIMHCDIKPDNFIMFPNNLLRLADFGIAKVAQKTIKASGSGTLGHMAPEQAMGRPSLRSDVFALGLIMYRMLTGHWPEYPYVWPPPRYAQLRRKAHPDLIKLIQRALEINPRRRYRDAENMLNVFRRLKSRSLRFAVSLRRKAA